MDVGLKHRWKMQAHCSTQLDFEVQMTKEQQIGVLVDSALIDYYAPRCIVQARQEEVSIPRLGPFARNNSRVLLGSPASLSTWIVSPRRRPQKKQAAFFFEGGIVGR